MNAQAPVQFNIDWSVLGIINLLAHHEFKTVLDIGSGRGEHARFMRHFGKDVYTIDLANDADYVGDFLDVKIDRKFDVVFCSHVMEHQRNVGRFLEKIYDCLADDGILMLAVPTQDRAKLISGHMTVWTSGLMIYNLIYAGFDCSEAKFVQSFDINLIVRKKPAEGTEIGANSVHGIDVVVDNQSAEDSDADHFRYLQKYFPYPVRHGGNAAPTIHNWERKSFLPFTDDIAPVEIICKHLNVPLALNKDRAFEIG